LDRWGHRAPEICSIMKTDITFTEIRAGVISSLVLAVGYLYITPFSSRFHVWAFIVLVAVCFVQMMKSLIDLFILAFGLAAAFSGRGLGRVVRSIRSS
jgi:hypothetical protein